MYSFIVQLNGDVWPFGSVKCFPHINDLSEMNPVASFFVLLENLQGMVRADKPETIFRPEEVRSRSSVLFEFFHF